jgi:5-methylcytosine-specific restriction endonuclease McrA
MARDFAKQFYNSTRWLKVRQAVLSKKHGICERCGKAFPSKELIVHHRIHLDENNINDPNITLNQDNLELLCHNCHAATHSKNDDMNRNMTFDENGNIIDVL